MLEEVIAIGAAADLPTVYVDKSTKKFIMEHPVKYSKQFTEKCVTAQTEIGEITVAIADNAVVIENLAEAVTRISFKFIGKSANGSSGSGFYSVLEVDVPVVWY